MHGPMPRRTDISSHLIASVVLCWRGETMTRSCRPAIVLTFSFVAGDTLKPTAARIGARVPRMPRNNAFDSSRFRVQNLLVDWLRESPAQRVSAAMLIFWSVSQQPETLCLSPLS